MKDRDFSSKIVEWYQEHHRTLPWRKTRDPYKIWLSEIILQQTRVAQGLPYYLRFVKRYPSVTTLAAGTERDILRLWQGLGYYSRARNLRKCARAVVDDYNAKFPHSFTELKTLPGIGEYTAAAIASFSFDEQVAVVDGNVFRVLARVFGVHDDISTSKGKKKFAELANRLIPEGHPGQHNQAVMEFGATHCLPRNPKCDNCLFQKACFAYRHEVQHLLPVKEKAKKPTHRYFYYFVVRRGDKLLMRKRMPGDIWTGLYDFPLFEGTPRTSTKRIRAMVERGNHITGNADKKLIISGSYKHILSHQIIHARFVELAVKKKISFPTSKLFDGSAYYGARQIDRLPKPVLISRYLSRPADP